MSRDTYIFRKSGGNRNETRINAKELSKLSIQILF